MPAKRSLNSVLPLATPAEPPKAGLVFERLADETRLTEQKPKALAADRLGGVGRQEEAAAAAFGGRLRDDSARVLRRFELRQDGSKVTLVDADGSTYEGYVTSTNLSEGEAALAKALALPKEPKPNDAFDADKLE
ncbi:MAG: hypothetical protein NTW03_07940, partial [Verrucomicrobia bacterium]|nr:hypothetical protein [Verrucomicrobiota bacterium]